MDMKNPVIRGSVYLLGFIVFLVACAVITFSVFPANGAAVGLPVIMVPGEPYDPSLPVEGFRWTNTLTATVLATLAVLAFAFFAVRGSKNWTNQVPGRYQAFVETIYGGFYNFGKGFAGKNIRLIFPLCATILCFLLAANWMKLLPGVESVGVMHCAEEGFNGYPVSPFLGSYRLYVDQVLYSGIAASEESYKACSEFFHHGDLHNAPSSAAVNAAADQLRDEEATLREQLTAENAEAVTIDDQVAALRLEVTETIYHDASYGLSETQMRSGAFPYIFIVTPFVRGASTDLNLTLSLAIIAVIAIQIFGVIGQGPAYFEKYLNVRALGNLSKKPLGAVDFIVGLFEIISELGKVISLAFRLFGNMFAGGILLIVMSFLVGILVPAVFIGLEVIVTTIQALVFALLTLIFAAQAMEGHHGDADHDDGHEEVHA